MSDVRLVRTFTLAAFCFALGGCHCEHSVPELNRHDFINEPLSKFCSERYKGHCPTATELDAEALHWAAQEWIREGACSDVYSGTWRGGTFVFSGGGFCSEIYWFDHDGALAQVRHSCENDYAYYGWAIGARTDARTSGPDLCDRSRALIKVGGLIWEGSDPALTLDGSPLDGSYIGTTIGYGAHRLAADGRQRLLQVLERPAQVAVLELGEGELTVRLPGRTAGSSTESVLVELADGGTIGLHQRQWLVDPSPPPPPEPSAY